MVLPALRRRAQGPAPRPLAALQWLAGCWDAQGGEARSGEQWLSPAGGTMLGVSRTVRSGRTVAHEFMQTRLDAGQRLVLIALPSAQKETTFVASRIGADEVVFENPAHDFPQRVIDRLRPALGAGRVLGRIAGLRNGQARGIDLPFRRAACEPR